MIARIWRGRTAASKSDEYLTFLERTGLKDYGQTEGNRGVLLLRRTSGGVAEFTALTLWVSMEAIRRFAGDQPERARYYPEDPEFLLEMNPFVEHYEVAWHDLSAWRPEAGG
ncbi:MAG: antibiotic biosynthesis monooxygenase family protein [Candidatus Limnocylindria bacterium]